MKPQLCQGTKEIITNLRNKENDGHHRRSSSLQLGDNQEQSTHDYTYLSQNRGNNSSILSVQHNFDSFSTRSICIPVHERNKLEMKKKEILKAKLKAKYRQQQLEKDPESLVPTFKPEIKKSQKTFD